MIKHENLLPTLDELMKKTPVAEGYIRRKMERLYESGWQNWFMAEMERESGNNAYPSQGLVKTPHDGRKFENDTRINFYERNKDYTNTTLVPGMLYFLELANHPERIKELLNTPDFEAPKKIFNLRMWLAGILSDAISIDQVGLGVDKANHQILRASRTEYYKHGPFRTLGHYSRQMLVGSANPEVWGSAPALAHMAESHCLVGIPRDGYFTEIKRQVDLAKKAMEWLEHSPV